MLDLAGEKLPPVTLLEDVETPYGRIEIVRARSGAVLYRQGSIHQSESVDGNGVSLATYIHAPSSRSSSSPGHATCC